MEFTHSQARSALQPSLIDRLRDDQPHKTTEAPAQPAFDPDQIRARVRTDWATLLGTVHLHATTDLDAYPELQSSVLNYGMLDLTGSRAASLTIEKLARQIRDSLLTFDPRIAPESLKVTVQRDHESYDTTALRVTIQADLIGWSAPVTIDFQSKVDLETGRLGHLPAGNYERGLR
ncbi:type VI secretion system baseplate subunit TssE [Thalassoroseus pseudoceratinae]|uniref:type VI secretion system baseplate subunit TssE n=1 Tax=Thalassoroseus pseudoceratinae TaxID=2713176 RepID=UPI001421E5D3|nr:type VI secretion system baseplate subunit TssE [Thalassoroseus pseudoceratinae]